MYDSNIYWVIDQNGIATFKTRNPEVVQYVLLRSLPTDQRTVVVVILWYLGLQLPSQSVAITTNVVSSNPVHGEVYSILHYVIKLVSHLRQVEVFIPGTLVSFTNKTDRPT